MRRTLDFTREERFHKEEKTPQNLLTNLRNRKKTAHVFFAFQKIIDSFDFIFFIGKYVNILKA